MCLSMPASLGINDCSVGEFFLNLKDDIGCLCNGSCSCDGMAAAQSLNHSVSGIHEMHCAG